MREHSDFFDRLVELIAAKYYVPEEANPREQVQQDEEREGGGEAGGEGELEEGAPREAPAEQRQVDAAERVREAALGPDADADKSEDDSENDSDFEDDVSDESDASEDPEPARATEGARAKNPRASGAEGAAESPETPAGAPPPPPGWSVGEPGGNRLEELRERLQAKIAASRVARKAVESQKAAKAKGNGARRRKDQGGEETEGRAAAAVGAALEKKGKNETPWGTPRSQTGRGMREDFQFGRMEVDGKIGGPPRKKRAKKEELLRVFGAGGMRKEIEDAGGEETAAGKVAEDTWDAALRARAARRSSTTRSCTRKSVKNEARMKKKFREKCHGEGGENRGADRGEAEKRKDSLKSSRRTPRWRNASRSGRRNATELDASRGGPRARSTSDESERDGFKPVRLLDGDRVLSSHETCDTNVAHRSVQESFTHHATKNLRLASLATTLAPSRPRRTTPNRR